MNSISVALILTILALLPCVFLAAGKDTDRRRAVQRECQAEALLDWTDKAVLAAEHENSKTPAKPRLAPSPCPVTIISRDNISTLIA